MKPTITVADSLFLPYAKSTKLGGGNEGVSPSYFEWGLSDPLTARFVTDSDISRAEGTGQIALLLETFFLHPENYLSALEKLFEAVLTHNSYFAQHKGWLWYPHGGSFVPFSEWRVHEKTKDVSVLLSPKQQLWGHKNFHQAAERFGCNLDVYGLEGHVDKLTAIAPYRYTIVCEAEQTPSFFSEKLIDCLAVGTIPIYWGCPNIGDFFDKNGILRVNDLETIGYVLKNYGADFYYSHLDAIETNLRLARNYAIPEDWIYREYPELFEEKP